MKSTDLVQEMQESTIPTKSKEETFPKEFPYTICRLLKHKLDILIKTLEKKDVWIMIDGDEGSGKTNAMSYLLYYFHCVTGRPLRLEQIYFDSDEMFNYVKDHEKKLIGWDEMVLGGMANEWMTKSQKNLLKFAFTGRKKHHIFIMCVPRFDKIKSDLRTDRIHALIHLDLGKKMDKYGHFTYYTRRGLRMLNSIWIKKKFRAYRKVIKKGGGFYCTKYIPYMMPDIFDMKAYEKKKDDAISQIGEDKKSFELEKSKKAIEERNSIIVHFKKKLNLSEIQMVKELSLTKCPLKKSTIHTITTSHP